MGVICKAIAASNGIIIPLYAESPYKKSGRRVLTGARGEESLVELEGNSAQFNQREVNQVVQEVRRKEN